MTENAADDSPQHDMTTQEAMAPLFKLAARAPMNIAPERQEELKNRVFKGAIWPLYASEGPASFSAIPEDKAVYASWAGQASLWCLSYASFQIMDIATKVARSSNFASDGPVDFGEIFAGLKISEHVRFAKSLFRTDQAWPSALYRPMSKPKEGSEAWLVDNLYLGALAWILLHEVGHVHHEDQKFVPAQMRIKQEYRADQFATEWVLSHAGRGLSREYRALAIVVAMSWLFLNEIQLGPGATHPAAILRFREAVQHLRLEDRSVGLESSAYVLKAIFDPESTSPKFDTSREAFDWVANRLDQIFGAG